MASALLRVTGNYSTFCVHSEIKYSMRYWVFVACRMYHYLHKLQSNGHVKKENSVELMEAVYTVK